MTTAGPGRARRERTATESLLSIALVLEAVMVFFVTLTVYGLEQLPPAVALGGGVALMLLLALDARLVRFPAGVWLGWVLQLGLILLGIVSPVMWVVGAGFAALWVFCFVKGRQLDRAKAAYLAAHPAPDSAGTIAPEPNRPSAAGTTSVSDESKETE
ncbi:MAG: DUF4233 domain-containing protein [Actinomycetota bacterium]|nr:DUF4233 domain-containing protein [Actinomycetota bacterium]